MVGRRQAAASAPPAAFGDRTADSRQRLIDAAIDLFLNVGYQAVRISDITDYAGLGKGTFYLHFDDKRDLLLACFRSVIEIVEAGTAEYEAAQLDYLARVARRTSSAIDPAGHWTNIDSFLRVYVYARDEDIAAVAREVHATLARLGIAELTDATAAGTVREIDPDLGGLTIAGVTEVLAWRLRRDRSYDADTVLVFIEDFQRRAFGPPSEAEEECARAALIVEAAGRLGDMVRSTLPLPWPPDKNVDTREKIIRAAVDLLLDVGYHRLRVDDVTAHAGIGKGTFYHHFESKRDLLLTYFRIVVERVQASEALIEDAGLDHLERVAFRMRSWLEPGTQWNRVVTFIRIQANAKDPEIAAAAWGAYRCVFQPIQSDLGDAQRIGLARECDAELAALTLAAMEEVLGWRIDQDQVYNSAAVISFMADTYCRAFLQ
ncbi:MAG: TetR/AcrR family transcriptional regulator [Thermoleophilia bacterium]|nr:TetR/AcrR family transcriptional regulator [Thermoleophilia bacterium]